MSFSPVTPAQWRAQVEKELAGVPFEKALVQRTAEGLTLAPLYTEAPGGLGRALPAGPFRICMHHARGSNADAVATDLTAGADALWVEELPKQDVSKTYLVIDADDVDLTALRNHTAGFLLARDPIARRARGQAPFETLAADLARVANDAQTLGANGTGALVSTLPYHDAGADAADEIALALASGAHVLKAFLDAGFPTAQEAARHIAVQIAVGRETFVELCKVRALRTCWQKMLTASGAAAGSLPFVHAVCSSRTLTVRDPWVNMLRVTTQVFSAVLGGADLVTPATFDQAIGSPSDHGRRVARNTGLVLREESFLGKVTDPAGGSYYLETLTDALAREAWKRFRDLESQGGIVSGLSSGRIQAKLAADWQVRLDGVAKRKTPILGVSEFANLTEVLPTPSERVAPRASTLPSHRDAEAFEALRTAADGRSEALKAVLVPLGKLEESRARVGFAAGFFGAGGIATHEDAEAKGAKLACLCGPDERYAAEGVAVAKKLKEQGVAKVLLAGRPGALEADLRAAGVDGFIFVGCDVVGTLTALFEDLR